MPDSPVPITPEQEQPPKPEPLRLPLLAAASPAPRASAAADRLPPGPRLDARTNGPRPFPRTGPFVRPYLA